MEKLQLLLPTLPRMRILSAQIPDAVEELGTVAISAPHITKER